LGTDIKIVENNNQIRQLSMYTVILHFYAQFGHQYAQKNGAISITHAEKEFSLSECYLYKASIEIHALIIQASGAIHAQ
jgi:hypothetical protein